MTSQPITVLSLVTQSVHTIFSCHLLSHTFNDSVRIRTGRLCRINSLQKNSLLFLHLRAIVETKTDESLAEAEINHVADPIHPAEARERTEKMIVLTPEAAVRRVKGKAEDAARVKGKAKVLAYVSSF